MKGKRGLEVGKIGRYVMGRRGKGGLGKVRKGKIWKDEGRQIGKMRDERFHKLEER